MVQGANATAGCAFTPLPHPGDLTGMSEPCGALPRKGLFIYLGPSPGLGLTAAALPCGRICTLRHYPYGIVGANIWKRLPRILPLRYQHWERHEQAGIQLVLYRTLPVPAHLVATISRPRLEWGTSVIGGQDGRLAGIFLVRENLAAAPMNLCQSE
jgi:hypothetical protein